MKFPTIIRVRGIPIEVESWDDLDEVVKRYGNDAAPIELQSGEGKKGTIGRASTTASLQTNDQVLLRQFIEKDGSGLFNEVIGTAIGARGKSIWPALRKWAVKIKLAESERAEVFERFNRTEGRGYKLKPHFLKVAHSLLGE